MSARTKADEAVALALAWAADDAHGYDQSSRWGPDYDCSSFLISVWQAVGVPVRSAGATYTGNMRAAFLRCGFVEVPITAGLRPGDVLLNEIHHTAMYVGDGNVVQASTNEYGGVTGGRTGDQTGREISVSPYYVYGSGWDCVLRYEGDGGGSVPSGAEKPPAAPTEPSAPAFRPGDRYMVQPGDSLWGIAERFLGDGSLWSAIYNANDLRSTVIHPGQVLVLPGVDEPEPDPEPAAPAAPPVAPVVPASGSEELPELRRGDQGQAVKALQWLLLRAGYPLPKFGADGELGEETEAALMAYQWAEGLTVTATTTPVTWVKLIKG